MQNGGLSACVCVWGMATFIIWLYLLRLRDDKECPPKKKKNRKNIYTLGHSVFSHWPNSMSRFSPNF